MEATVPSEIGLCTKLTNLQLDSNYLTGTIPTELSNLSSTQRLSLSANKLTGTLPTAIGSLTTLRELDLHINLLRLNDIPDSYSSLTNLEIFRLEDQIKNLEVTFPSGLCEIESLQKFSITCPEFDGDDHSTLVSLCAATCCTCTS